MSNKHVFLVINFLQAGGAERQAVQLAKLLMDSGNKVTILTFTDNADLDFFQIPQGVSRIHLGMKLDVMHIPVAVNRLVRRIQYGRPDAIVGFSEAVNVIVWLASWICRLDCCLSIRTNPKIVVPTLSKPWQLLTNLAYRNCKTLACQTNAAARWLCSQYSRDAVVIPNSIRKMPEVNQFREKIILSVGRLVDYKRQDLLLDVFADLHPEFPEWKLVFIGDGDAKNSLMKLAIERRMGAHVTFVPTCHSIDDWYALAEIFVLPSRFEGFPNALLEAMAMGCAVVSSNCEFGPSEMIQDGANGMLFTTDDSLSLSAALRKLLDSCDLRRRFGQAATEVRNSYSAESIQPLWLKAIFNK
ncbi:MAG: glycosyltransferase [Planctomycetales bacterium]|nr:glycosyltransferase [Planctomycetales bacterium]